MPPWSWVCSLMGYVVHAEPISRFTQTQTEYVEYALLCGVDGAHAVCVIYSSFEHMEYTRRPPNGTHRVMRMRAPLRSREKWCVLLLGGGFASGGRGCGGGDDGRQLVWSGRPAAQKRPPCWPCFAVGLAPLLLTLGLQLAVLCWPLARLCRPGGWGDPAASQNN